MNYLEKFRNVEHFIFDIDGVMTDGQILVHPDGLWLRIMNVRDGFAIRTATAKGYRVAVISGGTTPGAHERLANLGVHDVYLGQKDKMEAYLHYINKYQLSEDSLLYMGDDLPDYSVMKRAGLAACPSNSVDEIRDLSHYVSPYAGGHGCVRDVIEKVLKLRNDWPGYPNIQL
ncbi:MAG: HAD-IIIA family hydrolase [Saprospiraceae bacterium]|nr:HAD-IIIA family hydrolase [Saprospiraceae bacterium]